MSGLNAGLSVPIDTARADNLFSVSWALLILIEYVLTAPLWAVTTMAMVLVGFGKATVLATPEVAELPSIVSVEFVLMTVAVTSIEVVPYGTRSE